jgi:hypothetical protein
MGDPARRNEAMPMMRADEELMLQDDREPVAREGELIMLHKAYLASIRQHRVLMGDLCTTLARLADVMETAGLEEATRSAIAAGIDRHVDQARAIVADIDRALTLAAVTRPLARH